MGHGLLAGSLCTDSAPLHACVQRPHPSCRPLHLQARSQVQCWAGPHANMVARPIDLVAGVEGHRCVRVRVRVGVGVSVAACVRVHRRARACAGRRADVLVLVCACVFVVTTLRCMGFV